MTDRPIVQYVVLAGIVIHDGKVLLLKRSEDEDVLPGAWELPSGKKEPPENWRDGLIREIREESGLETEPVAPVDVYDYQVEKPDENRDMTQINFLMRLTGGPEVTLSGEHEEYAWVSQAELDGFGTSAKTLNAIKAAFGYGK
jgi:8-oxo-dGTP diphosphatase